MAKKDESIKIITYTLCGNIFLALMKGAVGLLTGSAALKADAVNSAGDVVASLVILLALRYALRPGDEGHHYGHGKMEALVSLCVGVVILISTGFLLRDVVFSIINCSETTPSFIALGAAAVSIVFKSIMYKVTIAAGNRLSSIALLTNAKDHRNDIIATSGAAAAIGLAFIGQRFGIPALVLYSEPVVAGIISIFIIKTAIEIIAASSRMLLDAAPDKKIVEGIRKAAVVQGVIKVDWLKCREMGRGLLVDAAIEVSGDISVRDGHDIGDDVKTAVMAEYPEVIDVLVHINPEEAED